MAYPLTLEDAKAYLRVDGDDDDAVIESLIAASFVEIENGYGLVAEERPHEMAIDKLDDELFVTRRPTNGSATVTYIDADGQEQTIGGLTMITRNGWSWIAEPSDGWPVEGPATATVSVGYENVDDYPADALLAAKMMVEARFGDRGAILPPAARSILDRYAAWRM